MATNVKPYPAQERMETLRQIARRANEKLGVVVTSLMTAEELQAEMIAQGVNPEENIGSRDILRTLYADDEAK